MASIMPTFPRMLKMLRENSNIKEKREALTYIRSNSKKLESTKTIKEEQYKDVCKLVVDAFANGNTDIQNEAYETLNVILRDFQDHTLNLFEAMAQISQKNRLKILKLLDLIGEDVISTFAYDPHSVNFFNNCMCAVQTSTMPWIALTACIDNIQALTDAESKPLLDDQRLEEETVNYCVTLLTKLYKVAARTSDSRVQRFNALLIDKIMLLAYMGHKRQRGPALKLLQQALSTNILSHVRTKLPSAWSRYIAALQSTYCKRMLLLVSACELDWATQWNISIQYLGVELHRGAGLINNLLSVEEKAFKSTDTIIRRQAFLSWKLLVDNFALDPQELATFRRIKLLCIPLNAKNSKTELIALTKLEVWWHVIIKLYKDISQFVNPVITQFLNFCFGPLGDTPLLSSKYDIVASPGKRFFKTKVVAVDALCQLLVTKQENHTVFSPILEERLPHSISDAIFQECYKSIIHSIGEALLVLSQLTDAEMKNRYQLGKILWTSLMSYIHESKMPGKEVMYKDMILVITELAKYAGDKPMIRNLILNIVLFEIADLSKDFNFQDDILSALVYRLLHTSILNKAEKNHYNAIRGLLWRCVKNQKENLYYSHAFNRLKEIYERLHILSNATDINKSVIFELWLVLANTLIKYLDDIQEINEGSPSGHNFKTVESIVMFPFMYMHLDNPKQVQELAKTWNWLYRQFEMRTDLITTVKSNEILLNIATIMQRCLTQNDRSPYLIISCLDTLLSTINYKLLLANTEVPSIIHLIVDLITYFLSNKNIKECESALKALSAVIITIYGHSSQKTVLYLQVCKPAIELMLETELEPLYKEVASTWDSVISIFKGLGKSIDDDLLVSYKKAITCALSHANRDIQTHTASLFELISVLSGKSKLMLEEMEKKAGKSKILNKADVTKKKTDQTGKQLNRVKMVGSFMRRPSSPKFLVNKETDKSDKEILIDSDSQEYVFIKTDLKFDVNRLTEHQKETLKRRREDIPALYNDLSQSSSQDTQNLQEWFDKKSKLLDGTESGHNKKDNASIKNILDDDANKENKTEMTEPEVIGKSIAESDAKSTEGVGQNASFEPVQKGITDSSESSLVDDQVVTKEKTIDNAEAKTSADVVTKDLNSNVQEVSLEKKNNQRLSPSVLDSGKRRNRSSTVLRSSTSPKSEEVANNQPEQSKGSQVLQRTLRAKVVQRKPESMKEEKRGIKRKSTSDSESDGTNLRQRRKIMSTDTTNDSDSSTFTENDKIAMCLEGIIDEGNLPPRTRNEISRLRINMAFDSPLSNYRRSKGTEDNREAAAKKQLSEGKGAKVKVAEPKVKNRGRFGRIKKAEIVNETDKIEDTRKSSQDKKNELEEGKKVEERKKEGRAQLDVPSTSVSDDTCDLLDKELSTKTSIEAVNDEKSNGESQCMDIGEDTNSVVGKSETQNDMEDIIENSQDVIGFERKCSEKQCFIKISKVEDVSPITKPNNDTVEVEEVANVVSNNCDNEIKEVHKDNVMEFDEANEVSVNEPKISTPITENNSCDNEKDVILEMQKVNEGTAFKSIFEFSSPKSNIKRAMKFRPYAAQGRAAHMLGLVTKQARMEADGQVINLEDEPVVKRGKSKDVDNDGLLGKKEQQGPTLKESDKTIVTCSSRQEKIFNNMRSADYSSSPPIKLFSNLKNDGEKFFSRTDKSIDCAFTQTDAQTDKAGEESLLEMDELPILEWSSANPPSLTASPSASILKRQRQSIPELDPEPTTPNKRKRVSFADPPVSKEMGYEITSTDSPHKANKFTSRSLLARKDSPLRLKHIRQKLISIYSDKMEKEDETEAVNTSEVDLQCERENELLTKIAEELEYTENVTIDTDAQTLCNSIEEEVSDSIPAADNARNNIRISNLSAELEITQDSIFSKHVEPKSTNQVNQNQLNETEDTSKCSNVSIDRTEFDDSATQEDIFTGTDAKHSDYVGVPEPNSDADVSDVQNTSSINNSLESTKFPVPNDSIIEHSSNKKMNCENLEDTVDAANLTGLNCSASSDEIFCSRLIRTSTQAAENIQEQDTLPVTDSVFGSLPLSQDSQNSCELSAEIPDPELLDSEHFIYPTLVSCNEPVTPIVKYLTNPLWVNNLTSYFANRNIETIGDLARLSEREVNRMPVKGNSKVEFVKGVLKSFEKTYAAKETNNTADGVNDSAINQESCSVNSNALSPAVGAASEDHVMKSITDETQSEPVNDSIPLGETSAKVVHNVSLTDKNASGTSTQAMEFIVNESSHISMTDISSVQPRIPHDTAKQTLMPVSASVSTLPSTTTMQMINVPVLSEGIEMCTSETLSKNSNSSMTSATSVTQATKSVGTCTSSDSIYFSKPAANKATKSVEVQMALEDLLDEIDVKLVLESAARRCSADKLLMHYKNKMKHVPQVELENETLRVLSTDYRKSCSELTLKAICRACGVNRVLLRLPDIFCADKQFFVKVLNAYRRKIKASDCLNVLDFNEVKDAVCQKCSSSELAEMLSQKLKEEEQQGITKPMSELSSFNAMLKRMPMDVIISHTVANDELIPSRVVLDIALQNNGPSDIADALESQSPIVTKNVFDKLWSSQFAVEHIDKSSQSKEDLLKIFKAVSSKLSQHDLLQAFYESMNVKLVVNPDKD